MTKQVQRRRGTATQHTSFTGAEGELSVNTTNKSVHVHDNVTAGGFEAARADMDNVTSSSILTAAGITATTTELNYVDGVTSNIQTQLDGKAGTASPTFTGTLTTANLTATGTTTLAGASTSADITFGDNDKAIFGAGSDLTYHDGNDSIIKESGAGHLRLLGDDIKIRDVNNAEMYIDAVKNGTVGLYYDNSAKLNTTATGIDVTGTVTADGLTVDGDGTFSATNPTVDIKATNGNDASLILMETTGNDFGANGANGFRSRYDGGDNALYIQSGAETTIRNRIKVDRDTGDISFYEDTGTTPKFFWDASAESLGIGTSSPSQVLHVESSSVGVTRATIMNTGNAAAGAGVQFVTKNGATQVSNATVRTDNAGNFSIFTGTTSETERMRIGSGGVVDIKNVGSEASPSLIFGGDDDTGLFKPISNTLAFSTFGSEAMRIDSSGNLLVGTTSASGKVRIKSDVNQGGDSTALTLHQGNFSNGGTTLIKLGTEGGGWSKGAIGFERTGDYDKGSLIFCTNNTTSNADVTSADERMRIDSSGNLLVGKTSADNTTDGATLWNDGTMSFTANLTNPAAGRVAVFNRRTADGAIVDFRKDGSTVGSISSFNSDKIVIGTGAVGIGFAVGDGLLPWNTTTNTPSDNSFGLGNPDYRFTDLYLSGGVYLGGTVAANKLDDYEEGTWTPTIEGSTTNPSGLSYTIQDGRYRKIGGAVYISFRVRFSYTSGTGSGSLYIAGLPFTSANHIQPKSTLQHDFLSFTGYEYVEMGAVQNNTIIGIAKNRSANSASSVVVSDAAAGTTDINGGIFYFV